jgi:hypothetical protein
VKALIAFQCSTPNDFLFFSFSCGPVVFLNSSVWDFWDWEVFSGRKCLAGSFWLCYWVWVSTFFVFSLCFRYLYLPTIMFMASSLVSSPPYVVHTVYYPAIHRLIDRLIDRANYWVFKLIVLLFYLFTFFFFSLCCISRSYIQLLYNSWRGLSSDSQKNIRTWSRASQCRRRCI